MELVRHAAIRSHFAIDNHSRRYMLGYSVFTVIAVVAVYLACGRAGITESELAFATVFP